MSCPECRRPCTPLPTEDPLFGNIFGVVFAEDEDNVYMTWLGPFDGLVAVTVIRPSDSDVLYYFLVPISDAGVIIPLDISGEVWVMWRREVGQVCSLWGRRDYVYIQGVTGQRVKHAGEDVSFNGEPIVHTRLEKLMVTNPNGLDYVVTNQLDPGTFGPYYNISF